jgi:subtilisin family serine protease
MEGTSMACPHVSGVAALGLSYAVKQRKHFTSREFRDLLLASVRTKTGGDGQEVNLLTEALAVNDKLYYSNWVNFGTVHPTLLNMRSYRGNMGSGVIDAGKLLDNIDGAGTEITLPNVYVGVGTEASKTIDVTLCFEGTPTAFTASSADEKVAKVSVSGSKVTVTGVVVGSTTFTVTPSGGTAQTARITVGKTANGNGWL